MFISIAAVSSKGNVRANNEDNYYIASEYVSAEKRDEPNRMAKTLVDHHTPVITAIVLISADVDRIPEVAQEIADLDGVTEVYSVAGDADLIALVRVRQHEDLADVIADRLNKVKGVTGTATHIAFRTYSKHDLETAFSLGLD